MPRLTIKDVILCVKEGAISDDFIAGGEYMYDENSGEFIGFCPVCDSMIEDITDWDTDNDCCWSCSD